MQPGISTNSNPLGSLGKLPPEVRIMIYSLILKSPRKRHGYIFWTWKHLSKDDENPTFPGLLLASKSIRKETLPMFYQSTVHYFCITAARLPNLLLWLRQLTANLDRLGLKMLIQFVHVSIIFGSASTNRASKETMLAAARMTRFEHENAIHLNGYSMLRYYPYAPLSPVVFARALAHLSIIKRWSDETLAKHVTYAHKYAKYLRRDQPENSEDGIFTAAKVCLKDGTYFACGYRIKSPDYTGPVGPGYDDSQFILRCNSEVFLIRSQSVYCGSLSDPDEDSCCPKCCKKGDCWHRDWWKSAGEPLGK
jgi:hypothetical protein